MAAKQLGKFSLAEVAKHNTPQDCWIVIDNRVYDVTKFHALHPGGSGVITRLAGQDVSDHFHGLHGEHVLKKYDERLCIGVVEGATSKREQAQKSIAQLNAKAGTFGDLVPYGDPAWCVLSPHSRCSSCARTSHSLCRCCS